MVEEGKFHTIFHEKKRKSCFSVLFLRTRNSHCLGTSLLTPEPIAGRQVPSLDRQRPKGERAAGSDGPFWQQPLAAVAAGRALPCRSA